MNLSGRRPILVGMDVAAVGPPGATLTQPFQGLVQGLAQRALQAALQSALAPQGASAPSPAPGLDLVAGAAVSATSGSSAVAAASPGAAPAPADLEGTGAGLDFPLLTALRHGAGVGTQAALTVPPADLPEALVRDPAAVPALAPLRAQAGGTGLEAAARAPLAGGAAAAYQVPAPPPGPGTLDLLA